MRYPTAAAFRRALEDRLKSLAGTWHDAVTDLASRVTRWTGNPCEVLDRSEGELAVMAADGERLLTEIRRDGRAVYGQLATVPRPVEVA